jgi:hypothetical protein
MKNIFSFKNLKKLLIPTSLLISMKLFTNIYNKESNKNNYSLLCAEEKIPKEGIFGTKFERTFLFLKYDGIERNLIGEIIDKMEKKGYLIF